MAMLFEDFFTPRWAGPQGPSSWFQSWGLDEDNWFHGPRAGHPCLRMAAPSRCSQCSGCPAKRERCQKSEFKLDNWEETMKLPGFTSDDITVYHNGRNIRVLAVHEDGDRESEEGLSRREVVHKLHLPANVIPRTVRLAYDDGTLTFTGRKIVRVEQPEVPEENVSEDKAEEKQSPEGGAEVADSTEKSFVMENESDNGTGDKDQAPSVTEDVPSSESKDLTEQTESRVNNPQEIKVSLPGFGPGDINVKVIDQNVKVTAEQKEESDGYLLHRRVERMFPLPPGVSTDSVTSHVKDDGVLTLSMLQTPQITQEPKDVEVEYISDKDAANTEVKDSDESEKQ